MKTIILNHHTAAHALASRKQRTSMFDAMMILDGASSATARELADASACWLNSGAPASTGTMCRNLRTAIDNGLVQRSQDGPWVIHEDAIAELES